MSFLNALLLAVFILGTGYGLYRFFTYREKPDASNPEHDTTNWEHIPEDWK